MNEAQIPKRWLALLRVLWFVFAILFLVIYLAGISPMFNELNDVCLTDECDTVALAPEEVDTLQELGLTLNQYAGYFVLLELITFFIFYPLAAVIFWRRSDTWMGYLLSLTFLGLGTMGSFGIPALVRLYPNIAAPLLLLDALFSTLFVTIFYIFPDGRFWPRWAIILFIVMVIGVPIDVLVFQEGQLTVTYGTLAETFWLVTILVGVLSQIYRYRKISTPIQRQQTKWVIFGLSVAFIPTVVWTLMSEIFPLQPGTERLAFNLGLSIWGLLFFFFPLSIAFSILQYRLWDIDIVINRSLVYLTLTVLLALIYFSTVILLQALFRALTDQGSPIAIVISTLVIAALFSPLRRRVQDFIDRRFYRRKYNAEMILSQFATSVRNEADLDRITVELHNVAKAAMQSEHVSVWLKEPAEPRPS